MLDGLALKRSERDDEAVIALVRLLKAYEAKRTDLVESHDAQEGFVEAFLMEEPGLAKAFTAFKLLHMVSNQNTVLMQGVAAYLLPFLDKAAKPRRPRA
jgi:hypothetical protein